jgi:L-lactate dehydrogenase complex protein LldF
VSHRVLHPPRAEPAPAVTVNLHRAAGNWAAKRAGARQLVDWEEWREEARKVRADAVAHLPELIERLEERVRAAGGEVHHAATAEDATATIVGLCTERGARSVAKAKSMTAEEIGLNEALERAGLEPVETDLGEYIVQQLGDRPSHILAPAVHLSAAQVAELFGRLSGEHFDPADTAALVAYARGVLREQFLSADVGITGVNMAVAETGSLVLVESEGNIRLSASLPRTHVALMGIEKVVRDWAGAAHLMQMLPLASHGRPAAASTSVVTGPARDGDDGPDELHLVLLDAGRSAIRGTDLEEALQCIRCGACLYACPVYRQVGGHAYGTSYSGPIGAVITPALERSSPETSQLPWMSSLCGACVEACPVKIPLDEQLVTLRASAQARDPHRGEAALFEAWARLWARPAGYRATARTAGRALGPLWRKAARASDDGWTARAPFPFAGWTSTRDARSPAEEPFHERWRKRRG